MCECCFLVRIFPSLVCQSFLSKFVSGSHQLSGLPGPPFSSPASLPALGLNTSRSETSVKNQYWGEKEITKGTEHERMNFSHVWNKKKELNKYIKSASNEQKLKGTMSPMKIYSIPGNSFYNWKWSRPRVCCYTFLLLPFLELNLYTISASLSLPPDHLFSWIPCCLFLMN